MVAVEEPLGDVASNEETVKILGQLTRIVSQGVAEEAYARTVVDGSGETITSSQFEVLRYIDRHELPTIKDVADGLRISSAAATKAVQGLSEEREVPLVCRGRGFDRRTLRLMTTQAGRDLVKKVRADIDGRIAEVLDRMEGEDREALVRGLRAFMLSALVSRRDGSIACLRCGLEHNELCVVHCAGLDSDALVVGVGAE